MRAVASHLLRMRVVRELERVYSAVEKHRARAVAQMVGGSANFPVCARYYCKC